MENQQHKFASLLNPIRDLAENWCIDIASELEEYLNELANIKISFDGGVTNLNFAEGLSLESISKMLAALVIQGSACVYSKKVEYLYSLVYTVLEHFIEQKQKKELRKKNKKQDEEEEEEEEEEELKFLPLDDIPEGQDKQIDLPENEDQQKDRRLSSRSRLSTNFLQFDIPQNLSYENNATKDVTNFKLTSCSIDPSGALLLEDNDKNLLNTTRLSMLPPRLSAIPHICSAQKQTPLQQNGTFTNEDDSSDDEHPMVIAPEVNTSRNGEPQDTTLAQQGMMRSRLHDITQNNVSVQGSNRSSITNTTEKMLSVWEPLDPDVEDNQPKKPFKKKKTVRVPRLPKDTFVEPDEIVPENFFNLDAKLNLKTLYHSEFSYIAEMERKRRKFEKAEINRQSSSNKQYGIIDAPVDESDDEENHLDAGGFGADLGGSISDAEDDEQINTGSSQQAAGDVINVPLHEERHTTAAQLMDIGDLSTSINAGLNNSVLDVMKSYEDLCREHLERYNRSVHNANDAQLAKRVQDWQQTVTPLLNEQDKRGAYDIEEYGKKVLTLFENEELVDKKEKTPKVSFDEAVQGIPSYEVCRLFLATLQLANYGNIDIESENSESFKIKLLSSELNTNIKDYRAPSIRNKVKQKVHHSRTLQAQDIEEVSTA